MKNSKIILWGLINSLGVLIYTAAVAWFLFNGEKFLGKADNFFMPLALLLLFVVSAAITGLLVLGRPIYLYLNGAKKEAISLLFYTIGWLLLMVVIVFVILSIY